MRIAAVIVLATGFALGVTAQPRGATPARVPPKRSMQIENGFGINSNLPREPYLPWDRWWWTRMFDAGFHWIRIGQYENSSEPTSWDWVERKRGVFAIAPEVDDYVDSLIENGVRIQVQLLYGNPMYTSPSGHHPDEITPKPGGFHNDDRSIDSIFWPPKTPDQIAAFIRYVRWMVNHFRGRIQYWALWNEQDIGYWNPWGNPEEYGRLLAAFAPAVHETDPRAKVIYGGQADPTAGWAKRALDTCQCAPQIDVFAYHTYPGYGRNLHPESMDSGAYGAESPRKLRQLVRSYPGMRRDIEFWDDEFNSIGAWRGSDDTVQTRYLPRGIVYNLAAGVRTFVWLLAAGVDGNEYDDFGLIHGRRELNDDFTPRPVFRALQNTNAVFSDTRFDPEIKIEASAVPVLRRKDRASFLQYGFRNKNGKAVVAYWVAAQSAPGSGVALTVNLRLKDTGIRNPVLIDITSGEISGLAWKAGTADTLEALPLRDSVMAIADASYFDWPVLPQAPSGLIAKRTGGGVALSWQLHDDEARASRVRIERRAGSSGPWQSIATPAATTQFEDSAPPASGLICYRVRAVNDAGVSACSNIVRVSQ